MRSPTMSLAIRCGCRVRRRGRIVISDSPYRHAVDLGGSANCSNVITASSRAQAGSHPDAGSRIDPPATPKPGRSDPRRGAGQASCRHHLRTAPETPVPSSQPSLCRHGEILPKTVVEAASPPHQYLGARSGRSRRPAGTRKQRPHRPWETDEVPSRRYPVAAELLPGTVAIRHLTANIDQIRQLTE